MEIEKNKRREIKFHNDENLKEKRSFFHKYVYSSDICKPSHEYFYQQLDNIKGKKILDYGCGIGSLSMDIAKKGGNVIGIDISSLRIKEAKFKNKKELNIEFMVGDVEKTHFTNETFDIIVGSSILHHLNIEKSMSELNRILKKGGKAIFLEPMGTNPFIALIRMITPKLRSPDEHPLKKEDIKLIRSYFKVVETKYFIGSSLLNIPLKFIFKRDIKFIVNMLTKIDKAILQLPLLNRLSWQVILIIHKI